MSDATITPDTTAPTQPINQAAAVEAALRAIDAAYDSGASGRWDFAHFAKAIKGCESDPNGHARVMGALEALNNLTCYLDAKGEGSAEGRSTLVGGHKSDVRLAFGLGMMAGPLYAQIVAAKATPEAPHTEPLSEDAERMMRTFPLDGPTYTIPLSDPLKIFSNLLHLSKFVDSFDVYDLDEWDGLDSILSLWAENQSVVTTLIVKSLAEQTASPIAETPDTVELISLYGQQLELIEMLVEMSDEREQAA
jgi:hypothetical protein